MKTPEDKAQYCREWREKNREQYLRKKRECYQRNKDGLKDKAKERASRYYYKVKLPKRKSDPELYKTLDREHSIKRREIRRNHLRELRERLGGKCSACRYHDEIDILQFHHHQKNKEKNVTELQNYKKREVEALKCILLCPNCHAIETLRELRK